MMWLGSLRFRKFWTLQESRPTLSTVPGLCSWTNALSQGLAKVSPTHVRSASAASLTHFAFALSVARYFTPTIFSNIFFNFGFPWNFHTVWLVIKKLIEKKIKNKFFFLILKWRTSWGGCRSYFLDDWVKFNFNVIHVIGDWLKWVDF